ncbi:hypothetical protein L6452_06028 [Arctium lappa]|uniref:Uncharacterized protein n=1 Tax=Arctium lappa TaxID=4217 RepID=A0ACB9EIG9_ARCLA|nr:hypothetical protein L6452_06028 [Arctium lappa]
MFRTSLLNKKKNTPNKPRSNLKIKKANNFVQVWVPIVKNPVSNAIPDSTANRKSAANSVSTANKASAASSSNAAKPIILTKATKSSRGRAFGMQIVVALGTQQITWTAFKFFKRFDGGHVTFDSKGGSRRKGSGNEQSSKKYELKDGVKKFFRQERPRSMASMAFIDEHNEIAMLLKPKQAAGFHQIVDFLKTTHIAHALTVMPSIFIEHQRQL